jgi:dolichyl-diphosphooligosaccharide--protein glycosyltransferase
MRRLATPAGLVAAAALAFGVRALGFRAVFVGDAVVFPIGDAYYHLRRALWIAEHWPALLRFDPLVAYPDGSWIPWPPLYDLAIAGLARALDGPAAVEAVAAWLPPLLGALTVLPVFAAAALLGGRGVGLGAALLFALLPPSVQYSDVGNADHHCLVSFLGALWLWGALAAVSTLGGRAAQSAGAALCATARTALLLTWQGGLLYVAVADGAQIAVLGLAGRRGALAGHAAGLALAALAIAAALPALGPPVGGAWSAIALSKLHVAALAALAVLAALAAAWEGLRPARGPAPRAARLAVLALAATGAALLLLPGLRGAAREALVFVGKGEPWAELNAEQLPLLRPASPGGWLLPLAHYGGFALAIPLVPLFGWLAAREPGRREAGRLFAAWSAAFGALAVLQLRYGNDFAPAAAVGFAGLVDALRRRLAVPLGATRARLAAGSAALVAALPLAIAPAARALALAAIGADPIAAGADPSLATPAGSLYRFAQAVRAATPETAGFDDPELRPAYAILASPNLGHVLHYVARRATPADNFGPYAGSRHFHAARNFFFLASESEAVALARRLGARYAITMEYGRVPRGSVTQRLHRQDGLARPRRPRWERFRLVTEGPAGGTPLASLFGVASPPGAVPYKLFEIVEGAQLEVTAPPGTAVEASVAIATPLGRRFEYRAEAQAGADGVARLRLPYATETSAPARPIGPWQVRAGHARFEVPVSERAVREGAVVAVPGARG